MLFSGLITGTLGYSLKREFLAESIAIREVETYNYEIFSVDFGVNPLAIQNQIQNQFLQVFSGDVHVDVFASQNTFSFPSDSLNASRYNVVVELKKPVVNLSANFPELSTAYYTGINANFWTSYGPYLLGFREDFNFSTNDNGNREFNHNVSFGLQTGWSGDNSTTGRKVYAQNIVSQIFANDTGTTFGLYTMVGQISTAANSGIFRNYYNESYDLLKNVYSFGRKREELPFDYTGGSLVNLSNSISMNADGTMDVSEKASTLGYINFNTAKNNLENYYASSFTRCSNVYNGFYNTGVIIQDGQYTNAGLVNGGLLPLINTPVRATRVYDSHSLTANYDVTYTNNPNFSGDGTITSQIFDFNIDEYNRIDITHTFDYTVNKIINSASYISTLISNTTGSSPAQVASLYLIDASGVSANYPNINLVRTNITFPNIKPKATAKLFYSNDPTYFVTTNGQTFSVLDYSIENKHPVDMVNEYKIINTPNKQSILSYAYQTDKGEITVTVKASVGKHTSQFYPDGVGDFTYLDGGETYTLANYLMALYKFAGQVFLYTFSIPTVAFNWFISDSKYTVDSDGNLNVVVTYVYTIKKRLAANFP